MAYTEYQTVFRWYFYQISNYVFRWHILNSKLSSDGLDTKYQTVSSDDIDTESVI